MEPTGRPLDEPEEQSPTRKPHILVLGKTADLIRGDYGNANDAYARYHDGAGPG